LQVEHPVTEMVTGEDLVEWQLRVAAGERLALRQAEITRGGHAIEVRLCAENPANNFLPETGRIAVLRAPRACHPREGGDPAEENIRLDTGVREGDEVSVYYDPMIAKLVAWGADRPEAARRMQEALAETEILGVTTNLGFLERVVKHPAFLAGDTDTGFIERHRADLLPEPGAAPAEALVAAAARAFLDEQAEIVALASSPWNDTTGWRLNAPALRRMELQGTDGVVHTLEATMRAGRAQVRIGMAAHEVVLGPREGDRLQIALDDETYFARAARLGDLLSVTTPRGRFEFTLVDPFHYEPVDTLPDARLTALMPGRVVKVLAAAGEKVAKGQALMILEAMKMEHTITSPRDGVIERVAFRENDLVPADAVLVAFRGE
ncbi:MAG: 3-methylcrotonyl-CoA carboxylase, partial [Burkholderiales bacterium]|nr:3-methylcrotonyl-CoA carboxylase [Burkholderiales bacterium]